MSVLACPVCAAALPDTQGDLQCTCGRTWPAMPDGGWALIDQGDDDNRDWQADIYDSRLGEPTDFLHPHNLTLVHQRGLLDAMQLQPTAQVLEIGGHRSGATPYLEHRFGISGHGVDVSPVWVNAQNRWARARNSNTTWVLADAAHLPFRDDSFDAIVAFDVLEHVTELGAALDGIARVLRPGGQLVCHQPVRDVGMSLDGIQKLIDEDGWTQRQLSVGHDRDRIPSKDEFADALRARGFEVVKQRPFNVLIQPFHDYKILPRLGKLRAALGSGNGTGAEPVEARDDTPRGASGFQRHYARWVVPVLRVAALPDHVGARMGVGGSCSYVAVRG